MSGLDYLIGSVGVVVTLIVAVCIYSYWEFERGQTKP